jgi:hypothetical protein
MGWIQQHYEFIGVVLAVITAVIAWLQLRKKEPSTTSLKHSRVDHSPTISGSHNQVIIGQVPSPLKPPEPTKTERASPNFVYAGPKQKDVFVSPWPRDGICDPSTEEERAKAIHALVLKFENRIPGGDRKIARALNVIAKLKYRHKNGATEHDISYGVWLNSPCNSTDIGIGDTRELVLMCVLGNNLVTFEDRRIDNRDFYSEAFSYFSYVEHSDVQNYECVDITLVDQNTQASLSTKLKVWREGESFRTSEL